MGQLLGSLCAGQPPSPLRRPLLVAVRETFLTSPAVRQEGLRTLLPPCGFSREDVPAAAVVAGMCSRDPIERQLCVCCERGIEVIGASESLGTRLCVRACCPLASLATDARCWRGLAPPAGWAVSWRGPPVVSSARGRRIPAHPTFLVMPYGMRLSILDSTP